MHPIYINQLYLLFYLKQHFSHSHIKYNILYIFYVLQYYINTVINYKEIYNSSYFINNTHFVITLY